MSEMDRFRLTYRPAKGKQDAQRVNAIQSACSREITTRIGEGHWTQQSDVTAVLRSMRKRSLFLVFTDEEEEAIASFAVAEKMPRFLPTSLWRVPDAKALGVFGIAVLPSHQRQGIGTWIMRQIEQMARERDCGFVRLDAYEANSHSVGFYRKLGYDERGKVVKNGVALLCFEYEIGTE